MDVNHASIMLVRTMVWIVGMLGIAVPQIGAIIPVSTQAPGGLEREEIPQFIFVTFDDAVNPDIYEMIGRISHHRHADGSPVGFTFFVSTDWTDFYLVHRLHAAGHEIATHTITHTTGRGTDFLTWVREIEGCREVLHRYADVPLSEIRGFRAPYLAYNGATYEALHALGFDYSTSVSEPLGMFSVSPAEMIWPYTLHDGLQQMQWTGTGPTVSLPNLMEIPMWLLYEADGTRHPREMDPTGTKESLVALFKENFMQRYNGNRVPLGLWLHAVPWLGSPSAPVQANVDAMNEFLEWALQKPNVWVVGMSTLVDWMRNPLPASEASASGMLSPKVYEPLPATAAMSQSFPKGTVRFINNRPLHYPEPHNAFKRLQVKQAEISGVDVTLEITNIWSPSRPTGFQGQIRISNNSGHTIEQWSVDWIPGDFEVTGLWGDFGMDPLVEGRHKLRHHNWLSAAIPPGGALTATFGATGIPEDAGELIGSFRATVTQQPHFGVSLDKTPDGHLRLGWDRYAPIYHLQRSTDLINGPWETIRTYYGRNVTQEAAPNSAQPGVFYRIVAEH